MSFVARALPLALSLVALLASPALAQVHHDPGAYGPPLYHADGPWAACALFLVAFMFYALRRKTPASDLPGAQSPLWKNVDIGVVQIAVDGDTARSLKRAYLTGAEGRYPRHRRVAALRALIDALRAKQSAWRGVRVESHRPMSPPVAQGVIVQAAARAESAELPRVPPGVPRPDRNYREADPDHVVTIVLASRREIADATKQNHADADRVLATMSRTEADELVALRVLWSPSDAR